MQQIQSIKVDDLLKKASNTNLCTCFENQMCSVGTAYIEEIDAVFEEIDGIHENRHKYDLHWAFEDAQHKLKQFTSNLWKEHIFLQEKQLAMGEVLSEDIQKLNTLNQHMERKMHRKFKWYASLSSLVTLVEMGISILAVLGLSRLSHSGESLIHSAYLSMVFVGIMAFFKVFLETYWIKPQIDKWGWKLYKQASKNMRQIIVLLLGTTVAIREAVAIGTESEYDVEIVNALAFNRERLAMDAPILEDGLRVSM